MKLLHLSDPHFGTERPEVTAALLEQATTLAPDLVVLSGDITQRARRHQFDAAAQFIERLPPVPVFTVPGNHDIPLYDLKRRILNPFEFYRAGFYPELEPETRYGDIEVIGLNSAPRWRHHNGFLNLDRVARRLERFQRQASLLVVVLHHPLDCRRRQDWHNIITGGRKLAQMFSDHRVDLVLGGHIHDPLMRTSDHRYPGLAHPMIFTLAGTCISRRTRIGAPNSFNLIKLSENGHEISVERWDWSIDMGRFLPVRLFRFYRAAGGGWQLREMQREAPSHGRIG